MTEKEAIEKLKYDISAGEYSTTKTEVLETVLNLLEKKDKIIDEMSNEILLKEPLKYKDIKEVKQYFERKCSKYE